MSLLAGPFGDSSLTLSADLEVLQLGHCYLDFTRGTPPISPFRNLRRLMLAYLNDQSAVPKLLSALQAPMLEELVVVINRTADETFNDALEEQVRRFAPQLKAFARTSIPPTVGCCHPRPGHASPGWSAWE